MPCKCSGKKRTQRRSKKWLIRFTHGLGDAAHLIYVVASLRKQDVTIDVAVKTGRESLFCGLADRIYNLDRDAIDEGQYDRVFDVSWGENYSTYPDHPATKAVKCAAEVFHTSARFSRYLLRPSDEAKALVEQYIRTLPDRPFAVLHYEGNTSADKKNLPHDVAAMACRLLAHNGLSVVLLDWDYRSGLADGENVFCPDRRNALWQGRGTGDGETIAALIDRSRLMIGIDSGPLYVSCLTETPTLAVWTRHHPLHYSPDKTTAPNVVHLVPSNHPNYIRGDKGQGLNYFTNNYDFRTYESLSHGLYSALISRFDLQPIPENVMPDTQPLRSTSYDVEYYHEHKQAGLDYLGHGLWQEQYGRLIAESFGLRGAKVLDVGCAAGSIVLGLQKAGADAYGIDLNNHMIELGRRTWRVKTWVCDTVNLHLFGDASFDFIHSQQSMEHFRPDLVPFILQEWHRVLKPDGIVFAALDTSELYERQGRDIATEDPTHVCVKSMDWWQERLREAGFVDCKNEYLPALERHEYYRDYFIRYGWDWMLVRRA